MANAPAERPRAPTTPLTRVAELLESWPELEEVLIAQAPAFRRLRNPVLRRTVARVATLEQAAAVGGLSARELVAVLRHAAGLAVEGAAVEERQAHSPETPEWLASARLVDTIDAGALLDQGEVPLARVNARARELRGDEAMRIESPFRPAPLTDALERQGFRVFVKEASAGRFETWVRAGEGSQPGRSGLEVPERPGSGGPELAQGPGPVE